MKNILKFELRRCFGSKKTYFAFLLGIAISAGHVIFSILPLIRWLDAWQGDFFLTPHSAYGHWIGMDSSTVWPTLLYMLLPFLAGIPYSDSTYWDFNGGYCIQIFTRAKKLEYFLAKALAIFLSAFLLTFTVLSFDFFATAVCLPLVRPEAVTNLYSITNRNLLDNVFYTNPLLYTFFYIVLDGILIGAWETLSLPLSTFAKNRLHPILLPFIIYTVLYFVLNVLSLDRFALFAVLLPFQPALDVSFVTIFLYMLALPLISFLAYKKRGKCDVL